MNPLPLTQLVKAVRRNPSVIRLIGVAGLTLSLSSVVYAAPDYDLMVPMNDGVALHTLVYLPSDSGQYPAVLLRNPYAGSSLEMVAPKFTKNGYATVIQYVRGMAESEGQFTPFVNEHSDGKTTVEWMTEQPWCDGRLGLWGASYLSFCGFEVARSQDSAIKAIVNVSGWADVSTFITRGGALRLLDQLPWLIAHAAGQPQIPDQAWDGIFRTTPLSQFFQDSEEEVGAAIAVPYDYNAITIPVLHITGWNDYICSSTLEVYRRTKTNGTLAEKSKLVIGPWTHNQAFDPDSTKYGDADFGITSRMGFDSILTLSVAWFDEHVKDLRKDTESIPAVQYFTQEENRWKVCDQWPPSNASQETWYLRSTGGDTMLHKDAPSDESWLGFEYDPNNPVPTIGGPVSYRHPFNIGVKDQSSLEGRSDVLFFESDSLEEPLEIAGQLTVVLYASTDSLDTDFTAKLVEVRSDGYARMIEDGIIRARYRERLDSAILIVPNTVQRYELDLGEIAYRVAAASKLRLEISSGNFPKFDRNPNDGTEPFEATTFRTAHQKIFMSEGYPSSLTLTVVGRE